VETSELPLLRIGRLELTPGLHALRSGAAADHLVVTATVEVPASGSEPQYAWDVAWADALREAQALGADPRTAEALSLGAGRVPADGAVTVVAAHGEALLTWWLPPGAATGSIRVGPLPYLREVAAAAARRPAYVVVLADRHDAAIIAHTAAESSRTRMYDVGRRPGLQRDPHPDRPPAQHHGERHITGREPLSGGERNAEFIAGRVAAAADRVGAHIVLGAGDQHILAAVGEHLPGSLGPVTAIVAGPVPTDSDEQFGNQITAALDEITGEAIAAVGDLVASAAAGPTPAAVRGIEAVTAQLAEQQVGVLLVAADIGQDGDELVWAGLRQDAFVVQLAGRSGPLAGEPAAALLRRRAAG
jgi:hypothetical protein